MATATTLTTKETAKLFEDHVFKLHGISLELFSNIDARFMDRF